VLLIQSSTSGKSVPRKSLAVRAYHLNHIIMSTSIPRAARSIISDCASIHLSNSWGAGTQSAISRTPWLQRQFSAGSWAAATATPYVRKPATASATVPTPKSTTSKPVPAKPAASSIDDQSPIKDMTTGLADEPLILDEGTRQVDWARSFHGLSSQAFSKEAADVLMAPLPFDDVEVKPDGIIYLPEIKYRRILNRAFGPGAWGLAPRGETIVTGKSITREYALVVHGR